MESTIDKAIKILRRKEFDSDNYNELTTLYDADPSDDVGRIVEAFIAAAPGMSFMDGDGPYALQQGMTPVRGQTRGIRAKKKCKAKPCGNTCIANNKVCRKGMGEAPKELLHKADAAMDGSVKTEPKKTEPKKTEPKKTEPKKAEPKKAEPKGGEIVTTPKQAKKQEPEGVAKPRFDGDRASEIDAKYSGKKISDRTVEKWLGERLDNDYKDTPENIARLAHEETVKHLIAGDDRNAAFARVAKDREGYATASVAIQNALNKEQTIEVNGKTYNRTNLEFWEYNLQAGTRAFYGADKLKAEKTLKSERTGEKAKAKAQKTIDKFNKMLEDDLAQAKILHSKALEKIAMPESKKLEAARQEYDEIFKKNLPKTKTLVQDYQKGEDYAFSTAKRKFREMIEPRPNRALDSNVFQKYLENKYSSSDLNKYFGSATTKADLKKAFKEFAVQNHPDKGGDKELFQRINNKYQELIEEYP